MTRRWVAVLVALGLVAGLVYGLNCVKNVTTKNALHLRCEYAARRVEQDRAFELGVLSKLLGDEQATVAAVLGVDGRCEWLEAELEWYRWNLGRPVRFEPRSGARARARAVIVAALPSCVERLRPHYGAAEDLCESLDVSSRPSALEGTAWSLAAELMKPPPFQMWKLR